MERYIVVGKDGNAIEIYEIGDKEKNHLLKYAPRIELDSNFILHGFESKKRFKRAKNELKYIIRLAERIFKEWGRFGHWKDVLQITKHEFMLHNRYTVDFIGRFEYDKPGITSDLVPFIRDLEDNVFFIGILRKFPPGVGKPATIGGFRNIKEYDFANAAETAIAEGKEETNFKITSLEAEEEMKKFPLPENIRVKVSLGKKSSVEVYTDLKLIRVFPTANVERNLKLKKKRVYETAGYTLMAYIPRILSKKDVEGMLEAGDDAAKLMVCEVSKDPFPDFYSSHHTDILREALAMYDLEWD